jgi:hypothetical protein
VVITLFEVLIPAYAWRYRVKSQRTSFRIVSRCPDQDSNHSSDTSQKPNAWASNGPEDEIMCNVEEGWSKCKQDWEECEPHKVAEKIPKDELWGVKLLAACLLNVVARLWHTREIQFISLSKVDYRMRRRSQWPRRQRHELSSLRSWVRIQLKAWMSILCAFILCVGRGLATDWFPVQGVLLIGPAYRIKKLKSGQGPINGCRAIVIIIKIISPRLILKTWPAV